MLKHYTLKPFQLENKHIEDIGNMIDDVVNSKKDEYWKNYINYSFESQTAITIGLIDNRVKTFSSIFNREYYGDNVYRLLNRLLISDDIREVGGSKTNKGNHRFFDMIYQQVKYVKTLNPTFYFMSRQRENTKWLKWYFDRFNNHYNENMIVSDKQYWIGKGSKYDSCQTLIYPEDKIVPFKPYF